MKTKFHIFIPSEKKLEFWSKRSSRVFIDLSLLYDPRDPCDPGGGVTSVNGLVEVVRRLLEAGVRAVVIAFALFGQNTRLQGRDCPL